MGGGREFSATQGTVVRQKNESCGEVAVEEEQIRKPNSGWDLVARSSCKEKLDVSLASRLDTGRSFKDIIPLSREGTPATPRSSGFDL